MGNRLFGPVLAALAAAVLLANVLVLHSLRDITTAPRSAGSVGVPPPAAPRPVVTIGVVSRYAPQVTFAGYQPLLDYLNEHGDWTFELRLGKDYQDAVDQLLRREVAASFLGAWIYAHSDSAAVLAPLAAPRSVTGGADFHAVLVTRPSSPVAGCADLRGLRVAVPSPESWSGNWLQVAGLPEAGLAVADLDTIRHFAHHQTVAWQVLRGHFDAGVVKESVALRFAREGLRSVTPSPAIPGPPLVARRDGPAAPLAALVAMLLALDPEDPADRRILAGWSPEFSQGFRRVDEADYASVGGLP